MTSMSARKSFMQSWGLLLSLVLFMFGFFAVKLPSDKVSNETMFTTSVARRIGGYNGSVLKTIRNNVVFPTKFVLVVIDALRADFAFDGAKFPFIARQAHAGKAMRFRANAQAPTVTMPRIKALTTGTVPSFVDVILNLASPALNLDNLLHQWRLQNKIMWFFGDDTWLKLFPQYFDKFEGTTSFFVSDYTEVDDNVTRHIEASMTSIDIWDVLILHYLGLDHIGHTYGPKSALIHQKCLQMDAIVEDIYNKMLKVDDKFLLLVVGDHGMSDLGSHGGASILETSAAAAFLFPLFKIDFNRDALSQIEQIDIVALLSILTKSPIPSNSLGVLNRHILRALNFSSEAILLSLIQNAEQLCGLSSDELCRNSLNLLNDDALPVLQSIDPVNQSIVNQWQIIIEKYEQLCMQQRNLHFHSLQNFNYGYMVLAILIATLVLSICVYDALFLVRQPGTYRHEQASHTFLLAACFGASLALFSSSFVEEEHQIWYFLWSTYLLLLLFEEISALSMRSAQKIPKTAYTRLISIVCLMVLHRICRAWVRTGVKWAHLTDISDVLSRLGLRVQWLLTGISMVVFCSVTVRGSRATVLGNIVVTTSLVGTALYHYTSASTNSYCVYLAWYVYACCMCLLSSDVISVCHTSCGTNKMVVGLVLCQLLWCKPEMHPLLALILLSLALLKTVITADSTAQVVYVYSNVLFYYMGNSNSLGSIDISVGYIGLRSYVPLCIAPVMFIYHYSGPAVCILSLIRCGKVNDGSEPMVCRAMFVVSILLVCFIHKYHIFVWSVFAPKLFYECFHTVFFMICVVLSSVFR